ncbi:YcxB family protein [Flavobacterium sp. H4147]|uniref:YcxB family protein n=1 Tax=Flavobacterium sp. H4147 TaxID=3034149 RepID=UPI0023EB7D91|nr:YcxB family protein [Flavobacterium sp. H4147]
MYFEESSKERIGAFFFITVLSLIVFDLYNEENDLIDWIIRSMILILVFLMVQHSVVKSISKILFKLEMELLHCKGFVKRYKFSFTDSFISVRSPLRSVSHKWSKIEKAILTKDFFFLYVKGKNNYIISIANESGHNHNINELIAFVENNVTHVTKV